MTESSDLSWLDQFEPFGQNCEFGFVLSRYEDKRIMAFRWTFIKLPDMITLLNNDFRDVFAFENIVPSNKAMVKDTTYNWNFHSSMHSDGNGQFSLPDNERRKLFRIEHAKIYTLVNNLNQKLTLGGVTCVHSADGISDDAAQFLLEAIDARAKNRSNKLLVVGKPLVAKDEVGKCYRIGERAFRGVVAQLAPGWRAFEVDFVSWHEILSTFRAEG